MKQIMNNNWLFFKDPENTAYEEVTLPHTWNGKDGQDGGNDYYRGVCMYTKTITADMCTGEETWVAFDGVNASADVYFNGEHLLHHDGGYSTFRVQLKEIHDTNELKVLVDNQKNETVYPQLADFTFYGGIYRDVTLINVPKTHFDLGFWGSEAVQVTPKVNGEKGIAEVKVYLTGCEGNEQLCYELKAGAETVASCTCAETEVQLPVEHVHLWDGIEDPFLYTLHVTLKRGETVLDEREVRIGFRTFSVDPEQGFFLNGRSYPLHGVCRHQDRPGVGNALTKEHHEEDMRLIAELGANTIRLAHYQHAQYFYDLCDQYGMVVWAEIPYITSNMPTGRDNTITQMKELVYQNYNHPCIVTWGLSNEITLVGEETEDIRENHRILNDFCHAADPTRLTTMAVVSSCPIDAEYMKISDIMSWNYYYGWYGGGVELNGPTIDAFHTAYPKIPVGISEYGCEALNWHSSSPVRGDYSEEYQAYYHEEAIKQFFTRPYIWATHVWNMFDFGADARAEGGENGMNHKGLVSFDRKYRKDSFFIYKAWLSKVPFVHLCSKRYVDHVEDCVEVKVYSNCEEVELFANGVSCGKVRGEDHIFRFHVNNVGETKLEAVSGDCRDEGMIRKVDTFNQDYIMKDHKGVTDWAKKE